MITKTESEEDEHNWFIQTLSTSALTHPYEPVRYHALKLLSLITKTYISDDERSETTSKAS
jgi:hypothetical protein